jgi:hypothetical protein
VAIAHGFAKASGRPMAAALHANVGLMNATMAIYNAWCDRVPMLLLGATGPVDATRRRPWIDWIHTARDQGALVRDFTKWDDQPASAQAACESLLRAVRLSSSPPCAPAYVCLDVTLQEAALAQPVALPGPARFAPPALAAADAGAVARAAALLSAAERPVLLAGRVSRRAPAGRPRRAGRAAGGHRRHRSEIAAAFPTAHPLHRLRRPSRPTRRRAPCCARPTSCCRSIGSTWRARCARPASRSDRTPGRPCAGSSLDAQLHRGWSMDHQGLARGRRALGLRAREPRSRRCSRRWGLRRLPAGSAAAGHRSASPRPPAAFRGSPMPGDEPRLALADVAAGLDRALEGSRHA